MEARVFAALLRRDVRALAELVRSAPLPSAFAPRLALIALDALRGDSDDSDAATVTPHSFILSN